MWELIINTFSGGEPGGEKRRVREGGGNAEFVLLLTSGSYIGIQRFSIFCG